MEMERTAAALQRYTQQRRRHLPKKDRRQVRHVPPLGTRYVCGLLRRPQAMVRHQSLDETKNEKLGLLENRHSRAPNRTQRRLARYLSRRKLRKSLLARRTPTG